jgi:hypothetical protein
MGVIEPSWKVSLRARKGAELEYKGKIFAGSANGMEGALHRAGAAVYEQINPVKDLHHPPSTD